MIDVNDERGWIHVVRVERGDDWPAVFVIDGREYSDSASVQAAVQHAYDELERRRIPAEIESRPVSLAEPRRRLPSPEEYWRQVVEADGMES